MNAIRPAPANPFLRIEPQKRGFRGAKYSRSAPLRPRAVVPMPWQRCRQRQRRRRPAWRPRDAAHLRRLGDRLCYVRLLEQPMHRSAARRGLGDPVLEPAALPRPRVGQPNVRLTRRAHLSRRCAPAGRRRRDGKLAGADLLGEAGEQPQHGSEKVQDQVKQRFAAWPTERPYAHG